MESLVGVSRRMAMPVGTPALQPLTTEGSIALFKLLSAVGNACVALPASPAAAKSGVLYVS